MWRAFILGVLVLAALGIGGCSKGQSVTPPTVSPKEAIRTNLTQVAQTGQAGSEVGAVMQDIEKLKATEPATAKALEDDARQLMEMSGNQEAAKAKAQQMLKNLDAGGPASTAK